MSLFHSFSSSYLCSPRSGFTWLSFVLLSFPLLCFAMLCCRATRNVTMNFFFFVKKVHEVIARKHGCQNDRRPGEMSSNASRQSKVGFAARRTEDTRAAARYTMNSHGGRFALRQKKRENSNLRRDASQKEKKICYVTFSSHPLAHSPTHPSNSRSRMVIHFLRTQAQSFAKYRTCPIAYYQKTRETINVSVKITFTLSILA